MKVEIELDELCRLKRDVRDYKVNELGHFTSCAADGCVDHNTLTRDKDGVACSVGYLIAETKRLEKELAAYEPEDHKTNWVPVAEHKDYVDRSRKQICKLNDVVLKLTKERNWWREESYHNCFMYDGLRSRVGYAVGQCLTEGTAEDAMLKRAIGNGFAVD